MSNGNNLPNHNDNDSGDEVDSSDDAPESPMDERTNDRQDIRGQQLDIVIAHQPDHLGEIIQMAYGWFLAILFLFVIRLCWPLIIFGYIAYRLVTHDNQPGAILRRSRSRQSSLPPPYCCGWNRDAQAEGRVAFLIEDVIQFSEVVEMLAPVPLGIQNTQAHDPAVLVNLNNVQHTDAAITNENNEITNPNTHNKENIQTTTDGDRTPQLVMDDTTYNINPLDAIESQDETHSGDSSDEESNQITSSESGVDGDDENDSASDAERRGQASPTAENPSGPVQNNVGSNQSNIVNDQPITTGSNPLHNEAREVEVKIDTPMESARQTTAPPICSTGLIILKSRNPAHSSDESSDEQAA